MSRTKTRTELRSTMEWFSVSEPNENGTHVGVTLQDSSTYPVTLRCTLYVYSRGQLHKSDESHWLRNWSASYDQALRSLQGSHGTAFDIVCGFLDSRVVGSFGWPYRDAYGVSATACPLMTDRVVAALRGVAEDDAFDRLPIVADLLQDAGCDDVSLLADLRGMGYVAPRVAFYALAGPAGLLDEAWDRI